MDDVLVWLNVVACGYLFGWVFYIAARLDPHGNWGARIATWIVAPTLGLQMAIPFADFFPQVPWHSATLHVGFAVYAFLYRRRLQDFIRGSFPMVEDLRMRRRESDFAPPDFPLDDGA